MPDAPAASIEDVRSDAIEALAGAMGAENANAEGTQPEATSPEQSTPAEALDLTGLHETLREAIQALPPAVRGEALEKIHAGLRAREKELVADHTRKTQEVARLKGELAPRAQLAAAAERIFNSRNPDAIETYNRALMIAEGIAQTGAERATNGHAKQAQEALGLLDVKDEGEFLAKLEQFLDRRDAERDQRRATATEQRNSAVFAEANAVAEPFAELLSPEERSAAWNEAVAKNDPADFQPGRVGPLYAKELARVLAAKKPVATPPKTPVVARTATVPGGAEFTSPRDLSQWEREKRPPKGGEIVLDELRRLSQSHPSVTPTAEGLWNLMRPGGQTRQAGPPKL